MLVLAGMWAWCILAIFFAGLPGAVLPIVAAGLFGLGFLLAFVFLRRRKLVVLCFLVAFVVVLVGWSILPASNARNWQPEHGKMPYAEVAGDRVTVRNVRNFDYRSTTDFDVRYEDWTFDLDDVRSVDFVASDWGL
ncbi:MAG: hypothetical protein GY715_12635, partial [Planctomycetes bacterium]|nr:hypothetical protein [Planctomycetota bacterium]